MATPYDFAGNVFPVSSFDKFTLENKDRADLMTDWLAGKRGFSPAEEAFGNIGSSATPINLFQSSGVSAPAELVRPVAQARTVVTPTTGTLTASTPINSHLTSAPTSPFGAGWTLDAQGYYRNPANPGGSMDNNGRWRTDRVGGNTRAPQVETPVQTYVPSSSAAGRVYIGGAPSSGGSSGSSGGGGGGPTSTSTSSSSSSGGTGQTPDINAMINKIFEASNNPAPQAKFEVPAELTTLLQNLRNDGTYKQSIEAGSGLMSQFSKASAFKDAAALMEQRALAEREVNMPAIQRAVEGSGTSASSMQALLSQRASRDLAMNSAALGAEQAKAYGQIQSSLGSSIAQLVAQGDPSQQMAAKIQQMIAEQQGETGRSNAKTQADFTANINQALTALVGQERQQQTALRGFRSNESIAGMENASATERLNAQLNSQERISAANNAASKENAQLNASTLIQQTGLENASKWAIAQLGSQTSLQSQGLDADSQMARAILAATTQREISAADNMSDWDRALLSFNSQNYATDTNRANAVLDANTRRAISENSGRSGGAVYLPRSSSSSDSTAGTLPQSEWRAPYGNSETAASRYANPNK